MTYELLHGDCLTEMAAMDAGSVDAVVADPPYGLHFMGKTWDSFGGPIGVKGKSSPRTTNERPGSMHAGEYDHRRDGEFQEFMFAVAVQSLRVLRPSSYLLMTGGTRTWHRLACAIEDAGFEIRDTLMWLYGSGFPKGKSCLKPAWEPIILARKPGPMRELGIDCCRIPGTWKRDTTTRCDIRGGRTVGGESGGLDCEPQACSPSGRWPANLVLECTCDETREGTVKSGVAGQRTGQNGVGNWGYGAAVVGWGSYAGPNGKEPVRIHTDPNCPCAMLDGQTGTKKSGGGAKSNRISDSWEGGNLLPLDTEYQPDSGGASRFFFRADYDEGERLP